MNKFENLLSVVIVSNEGGSVATIRFKDNKKDKILSSTKHNNIYRMIEDYVQKFA